MAMIVGLLGAAATAVLVSVGLKAGAATAMM